MLRLILELVFAILTLCALAYYALVLRAARSFLRRPRAAEGFAPPVTILKPVRGVDPDAFAAFESHCRQDYPEFELVFGVSDPADPAVTAIDRLKQEFPDRSIRLLVCAEVLGANRKVSNLVQMLPHARHQHLIVNDSDIRVPPDYLRKVMAPFADAKVGMVTALYRGAPENTLGSKLESLGISTDFMGGVLAARALEGGLHFALGSTLAIRRDVLAQTGGFEAFADYLADDYEIARRTCDAGFRVEVADTVVDTHLPAYSIGQFLEHQLRWGRGIRDSRPAGYLGLLLTFGLLWSLLALLAAGGAAWAWALLGLTLLMRFAVAGTLGRIVLRDPHLGPLLWLIPLRDMVAVLVWCASWVGHTIVWRGERFQLKERKLYRVSGSG